MRCSARCCSKCREPEKSLQRGSLHPLSIGRSACGSQPARKIWAFRRSKIGSGGRFQPLWLRRLPRGRQNGCGRERGGMSAACPHRAAERPRPGSAGIPAPVAPEAAEYASTRRLRDGTAAAAPRPSCVATSGRTSESSPVSSSSSKALRARPSVSILVSSSRTRSRLTA